MPGILAFSSLDVSKVICPPTVAKLVKKLTRPSALPLSNAMSFVPLSAQAIHITATGAPTTPMSMIGAGGSEVIAGRAIAI